MKKEKCYNTWDYVLATTSIMLIHGVHLFPFCSFVDSIGIFLRWNRSSKYLDEAYEEMVNIIEYNKQLQAKVNLLRRQLAELETEDGVQESP